MTPCGEWLREENVACLSQVIKWRGDSVFYVLGDPQNVQGGESHNAESGLLAAPRFRGEMLARFRPGDCLLPARYLLQRKINEKLKTYSTQPRLLMNEQNQLEAYLYPGSLLAALWFQFYQVVVGEKKLKRCVVCGKWQDLTDRTEKQRERWTRHAKCANMLRQRKWRERRKRRKEGALNAEEEG